MRPSQTSRFLFTFAGLLALAWVCAALTIAAEPLPPAADRTVDFRKDVYPILVNRCFECHKGGDAVSGYRLDQKADLLGESDGKPLVRVGDSGKSRLIHLVSGQVASKVMPAKGPRLSPEEIGLLRAWIDQGMKWDDALLPVERPKSSHWAYQPVQRPEIPQVKHRDWVRTPTDAFIAARHEAAGLKPAPEADRRVLVRRLYLDLIGLPPTPEEIDAFEQSAIRNPQSAIDDLVEKLLASPHYGERWGRHWLDVVRYADSEGYESDHPRPYQWRYRDYVVRSFQQDKPFDRFLREQVAGDELEPYSDENLIATGFLAAARLSSNEEDKAVQRNDVLVDVVNATGNAFLGLTLHCAQCHNHKFDPFTIRDYYRFQGFFVKGMSNNLQLKDPALWAAYEKARPQEFDPASQLQQTLFEGARKKLIDEARKNLTPEQRAALDVPAERRTPDQEQLARAADLKFQFTPQRIEKAIAAEDQPLYAELKKKLDALQKKMPDKPQTFGFYSPATSPTKVEVLPMKGFYPPAYVPAELAKNVPYLLVSGEIHDRGPALDVGWPALFGPMPEKVKQRPRTVLADWLTDPKNPLVARVWVNRIWQFHFGRGLVATPNDFGVRGAKPTHPELLDYLASELISPSPLAGEGGVRGQPWSTKHIHRLIVNSSTYRQSSANPQSAIRNPQFPDPDNHLLWRWPLRRLESEAIRDSMLAVSGELDRAVGGAYTTDEDKSTRRTLYLYQRRNKAPQVQKLFDGPTAASESCPKRHVSTVPLQALFLLNNDFALRRATALAERVQKQAGDDQAKQTESAFRLALGRLPEEVERRAAAKFFAAHQAAAEPNAPTALVHFCQAILNLNEFVYIE